MKSRDMKHKYENKENKKDQGFTLIESMLVLFIIGLLSAIAGIGYGVANRHKMVELASKKITSGLDATRDYAIFGQEINGKYPCGYGIALGRNQNAVQAVYTSGTVMIDGENVSVDREGALGKDLTCDELISSAQNGGQLISLATTDTLDSLSFDKVKIGNINQVFNNSPGANQGCLVVLFSAPRGLPYYFNDTSNDCPPAGASTRLQLFSENVCSSGDIDYPGCISEAKDSNYFRTSISITEGLVTTTGYHNTYPSGNGESVAE